VCFIELFFVKLFFPFDICGTTTISASGAVGGVACCISAVDVTGSVGSGSASIVGGILVSFCSKSNNLISFICTEKHRPDEGADDCGIGFVSIIISPSGLSDDGLHTRKVGAGSDSVFVRCLHKKRKTYSFLRISNQ
jgi:hypothetical protein